MPNTGANADILSFGALGTTFSEILNKNTKTPFQEYEVETILCKMRTILFRFKCDSVPPFYAGINV